MFRSSVNIIGTEKKSAVFCHLLSRPDCPSEYDDSHFSALCRASYAKQLKVLEAVCIRVHNPVLCKQKKHEVALKLFSYRVIRCKFRVMLHCITSCVVFALCYIF